jgi:hypothetical protein
MSPPRINYNHLTEKNVAYSIIFNAGKNDCCDRKKFPKLGTEEVFLNESFKVVRQNPTRFIGLNPILDPKFALSRVGLALRV